MATLTPTQFVDKWSRIQVKESAAAQSHFNDVCALVGHAKPLEKDPDGSFFTFEAIAEKIGGKRGWADAWYKGRFIWEYKGARANLEKAYEQLLRYREALGNPPLLITSDMQRIVVHTNFTNTVKQVHVVDFDSLLEGTGLELLRRVFYDENLETFRPKVTQQQVTQATADSFVAVAETLQKWAKDDGGPYQGERLAHFLIRLLFCLFAEDMELLPDNAFTKLVIYNKAHFPDFVKGLRKLFAAMRDGGAFGFYPIPCFDGGLFDDDFVPEGAPSDILTALQQACQKDWSGIDPSIFGTLFERVIDESKRAQLGAHYTSRQDIMLIVDPVLMQPLRDEWHQVKREATRLIKQGQRKDAYTILRAFSDKLASIRVLDAACGSANFLYVALQQLLALQKQVIAFAARQGLDEIPLTVSPAQLYGIEIDPYAHQLAQTTVWIGYIQWRYENGFAELEPPILKPLGNIECRDAILEYRDGKPVEPEWPEADVAIGNPPFLGDKKMRSELGDKYVDDLRELYADRIPGQSDLVCYWFEKARAMIENGRLRRAGLLATNSIRGGANQQVLDRIKETGDIFMAWSDRPWVLEGAAVRVSMVGFDGAARTDRRLDGVEVQSINPDLTAATDLTAAKRLPENDSISFIGPSPHGRFDIDAGTAQRMLRSPNSNGFDNANVVRRVVSAIDIVRRSRGMWTIDFGTMTEEQAARYELPFKYVEQHIHPHRSKNRRPAYAQNWWLYGEPRPGMREAMSGLNRFVATPRVAKHRVFVWIEMGVLANDGTVVFAREDDYFLAVLHSKVHRLWSLRQGTSLEDRPRYTPSSTFETFPLPWPPRQEPSEEEDERVARIAQAARELVAFRQAWLHPPGVGITFSQKMLKKRTLTNLYNALTHYRDSFRGRVHSQDQWKQDVKGIIELDGIEELDLIHRELDQAVLDAYGWPHALTDEEILERLLDLNLERAGS